MLQKKRKSTIIILVFALGMTLIAGCNHSVENDNQPQVSEREEIQSQEAQSEEANDSTEVGAEETVTISDEARVVQNKLISDGVNKYKDIISVYRDISTKVWYTIDDLNHNGRLELIIATCYGTALYTDFTVFEVNESKDGIDQYEFSRENTYMRYITTGETIGDSLPDVIVNNVKWRKNPENNQYEYFFVDQLRVLPGEHYTGYYRVLLDENVIYQELIAYQYILQGSGKVIKEMYFDESRNEITEEQFNELILLDVEETELNWIEYEEEEANEGYVLNHISVESEVIWKLLDGEGAVVLLSKGV